MQKSKLSLGSTLITQRPGALPFSDIPPKKPSTVARRGAAKRLAMTISAKIAIRAVACIISSGK